MSSGGKADISGRRRKLAAGTVRIFLMSPFVFAPKDNYEPVMP
jgi:hypothetical protein